MSLTYRKATLADMKILAATRAEILRDANGLPADADLSAVERESCDYYTGALADGSCICYLVYDGDTFAGAGGVSFYRVMPTYFNPGGWRAYIMNMYTAPAYRRQGIAYRTLDLLVKEIQSRGITFIALEATEAGRPLYEKYGFIKMEHEMKLKPLMRKY